VLGENPVSSIATVIAAGVVAGTALGDTTGVAVGAYWIRPDGACATVAVGTDETATSFVVVLRRANHATAAIIIMPITIEIVVFFICPFYPRKHQVTRQCLRRDILKRMSLQSDLTSILHGEVACDDISRQAASRDASIFSILPKAVVHPMNVQDISALIEYASTHPGVSITPQSGRTDMSGGALTESIAMDITSHFTRIGTVTGSSITVEAGVPYRFMEEKTLAAGLIMPSYPASKDLCTVGGMVNTNAGGEKTLRYGKTDRYIQEMNVVLADGKEYTIYPMSRGELESAKKQDTFLGQVYTKMHALLENNYDAVHAAKPAVSKNSAGYALWDVWDRTTFDLTKLFTGSQGTLGITTQIRFRLVRPDPHATMLVAFLDSVESLPSIIESILTYRPESIESYDDHTLSLATRILPRSIGTALAFLPEFGMLLRGGLPKLVLLAEFTGDTTTDVMTRATVAQTALSQYHVRTRLTKNDKDRFKYWKIRRESFNLLRHHVRNGKKPVPFIDDFIVAPKYLAEFLPKLAYVLDKYDLDYTIAGHAGDGNFHIIPLIDMHNDNQREMIPRISEEVYTLVFSYKGSSTAEHNDGLIRSHLLPQMFGPSIYSLFEQTKELFDPKNIFNPGKKVGSNWKWAQQQIAKE
jgi:FAD/FMN-containing dehydrogenase